MSAVVLAGTGHRPDKLGGYDNVEAGGQGASRSGMLKAFGNAICAPLAATFLEAVIDCILES